MNRRMLEAICETCADHRRTEGSSCRNTCAYVAECDQVCQTYEVGVPADLLPELQGGEDD